MISQAVSPAGPRKNTTRMRMLKRKKWLSRTLHGSRKPTFKERWRSQGAQRRRMRFALRVPDVKRASECCGIWGKMLRLRSLGLSFCLCERQQQVSCQQHHNTNLRFIVRYRTIGIVSRHDRTSSVLNDVTHLLDPAGADKRRGTWSS